MNVLLPLVVGGLRGLRPRPDSYFLTDGYIPHTFTPQAAASYCSILFKMDSSEIQVFRLLDIFYVWNRPTISTQLPLNVNGRHGWLLDYHVRPGGSVVPQQIWYPLSQWEWCRYIERLGARLHMPLFFVNVDADGTLGVPIVNAAAGQMCLRGAGEPAPFGDKATANIRIGVCTLAPSMRAPITYQSGRSGQAMRSSNSRSN
jgi:hypothetical protein